MNAACDLLEKWKGILFHAVSADALVKNTALHHGRGDACITETLYMAQEAGGITI